MIVWQWGPVQQPPRGGGGQRCTTVHVWQQPGEGGGRQHLQSGTGKPWGVQAGVWWGGGELLRYFPFPFDVSVGETIPQLHSLPIRICNLEKNDITKYRIMQAHIVLIKALAEFYYVAWKMGFFEWDEILVSMFRKRRLLCLDVLCCSPFF